VKVMHKSFVAIDFETADSQRDSACAVALVRVEQGRIASRRCYLIRPPRRQFLFTPLHGITYADVMHQPAFRELWPQLLYNLRGIDFLAAHNASFDRSVMRACCEAQGLTMPKIPFLCTVRLARQTWQLKPATLPDVCRHLKIVLTHHHVASDAEACARIVLAAAAERETRRFEYHGQHPALLANAHQAR
jgi:DNA polymerase-3 subunit epsilon